VREEQSKADVRKKRKVIVRNIMGVLKWFFIEFRFLGL